MDFVKKNSQKPIYTRVKCSTGGLSDRSNTIAQPLDMGHTRRLQQICNVVERTLIRDIIVIQIKLSIPYG